MVQILKLLSSTKKLKTETRKTQKKRSVSYLLRRESLLPISLFFSVIRTVLVRIIEVLVWPADLILGIVVLVLFHRKFALICRHLKDPVADTLHVWTSWHILFIPFNQFLYIPFYYLTSATAWEPAKFSHQIPQLKATWDRIWPRLFCLRQFSIFFVLWRTANKSGLLQPMIDTFLALLMP